MAKPEISSVSSKAGTNKAPKKGKVSHFRGEIHDDGSGTSSIHYQPSPSARKDMMYEGPETAGHSTVDEMLNHLRDKVGSPVAPTAAGGRPKTVAKQTQPAPIPSSQMA